MGIQSLAGRLALALPGLAVGCFASESGTKGPAGSGGDGCGAGLCNPSGTGGIPVGETPTAGHAGLAMGAAGASGAPSRSTGGGPTGGLGSGGLGSGGLGSGGLGTGGLGTGGLGTGGLGSGGLGSGGLGSGGLGSGGLGSGGLGSGGLGTGGLGSGGLGTGGLGSGGLGTGGLGTGGLGTGGLGSGGACTEANSTICEGAVGTHCGFFYDLWKEEGTGCLENQSDGFTLDWTGETTLLGRKGLSPGSANQVVSYSATYEPNGTSYLCVYGWMTDPLVEYYIVDSWGSWRPPGTTPRGQVESDGGLYEIHSTMRSPGVTPPLTYWSVRTERRTSGTISIANHLAAWQEAGLTLGEVHDVSMAVEGYHSSGHADVTFVME